MFEENIIKSLHHFKLYLKNLLFIYIFGGNFKDEYDHTTVDKIFDFFNSKAKNKMLKNLLNNSIKNYFNGPLENCCDESDVRIDNSKALQNEIMMLSFRTLIEISTLPLTKDFRQHQSKGEFMNLRIKLQF